MNAEAETGSSTLPVDISNLKSGSYFLKIVATSGGQPVLSKFTKL